MNDQKIREILSAYVEEGMRQLNEEKMAPSEAFNETVEELTQSLMPLVAENG